MAAAKAKGRAKARAAEKGDADPSERSPVGRSHTRAERERDPETGRLCTILDDALLDALCAAHADGDFRNATALRCRVHPKMLSRWLKQGAQDETGETIYGRLFVAFCRIEAEVRAETLRELRNPTASEEVTTFDEGKPSSREVVSRNTRQLGWYLERRFRQFRPDWLPKEDEADASELLTPAAGALTPEAILAILDQLAASPERLPPAAQSIFIRHGWALPRRESLTHGS